MVDTRLEEGVYRGIAWCSNGHDDDLANAVHIARHDPARVLREVEATRALIAAIEHPDPNQGPEYGYGLRLALMFRAAVYSDHPDYDQSWKP